MSFKAFEPTLCSHSVIPMRRLYCAC